MTSPFNSSFIVHLLDRHSLLATAGSSFACLRATHRQAAGMTLYAQMEDSACLCVSARRQAKLDDVIRQNLKELGYGE